MLDDALKAAIGIGQVSKTGLFITAIQDTVLKRMPLDSQLLPENQKLAFNKGDRFDIVEYHEVEGHYKILSANPKWIGGWYAFMQHVKIDDPNVKIDDPNVKVDDPNVKELISLSMDQLLAIAPYTATSKLSALLAPLNAAMARYQINTSLRKAHFLAQVAHESDGFNTCCEYADGSEYEWRIDLGNTQEGDGVRFKGRSLIQITGRENYQQVSSALSVDFLNNPPLLEEPLNACLSAGWYWSSRNLNPLADLDKVYEITLIINGGYNGINERIDYLNRAKEVFGI